MSLGRPPPVQQLRQAHRLPILLTFFVLLVVFALPAAGRSVGLLSAPGDDDGNAPAVAIETITNGVDADWAALGPFVPAGWSVEWNYLVMNAGNEELVEVAVTDAQGGPVSCPHTSLAVAQSMVCFSLATATSGQYATEGIVEVVAASGARLEARDPSHYFGTEPALTIEKATNGADADDTRGLDIPVGEVVTWTYEITNTGNTMLGDILVVDDREPDLTCTGGQTFEPGYASYASEKFPTLPVYASYPSDAYPSDEYSSGENPGLGYSSYSSGAVPGFDAGSLVLAPGETLNCTASGTSAAGPYENRGTVSATGPSGLEATDADASHYYGANPGLEITKSTNGEDAPTVPGPMLRVGDAVTWTYVVTNVGNEDAFGVTVTDDDPAVTVSCPSDLLAPGDSMECAATGTAVAGQYQNIGTVTATAADSTLLSASDLSHYEAIDPVVVIEKSTNGEDADSAPGPTVDVGGTVMWTYDVTNAGDVAVTDIVVVDDDSAVTVSCPETTLAAGASMTCTASGVAIDGQYSNVGTVTGTVADGGTVTASDSSNYFGGTATITIEKATNGVDSDAWPGEFIDTGSEIVWTYVVANGGNRTLSDVTVTDNQGVAVTCPTDTLAAGEAMTCEGRGIATDGGYENEGQVTAMDPDGRIVGDSDYSHYRGDTRGRQETGSLGNMVWDDLNNDGEYRTGEPRLAGVVIELFADADGDGNPDDTNNDGVIDADGAVATTNTDVDGLYLFTGLAAGDYIVGLSPTNWDAGGPLAGYVSSDYTQTDPNTDIDADDNGAGGAGGYIWSGVITLNGDEPLLEAIDNDAATPDAQENLTVDFGLHRPVFDLAMTKSLDASTDPRTITEGDEVVYRLTVSNPGAVTATDIRIIDLVPNGLVLDDAAWTLDDDGNAMTTLSGTEIAPGDDVDVTIGFIFDGSARVISNEAEITGATPLNVLGAELNLADSELSNNADDEEVFFSPDAFGDVTPTAVATETPTAVVEESGPPTAVADAAPTQVEVTPTPTPLIGAADADPTATPTETPTPVGYSSVPTTPTSGPQAGTATPTPDIGETPTNLAFADPTATPQPTATATSTPRPTSTPKPTSTPEPTSTPKPTSTPVPGLGAAPDDLAFTGGTVLPTVLIGLSLLAGGAALVVATRRHTRRM